MHHVYYTKAKLAKFYEGASPACDRREQTAVDLIHMLCLCQSICTFRTANFNIISNITEAKIVPDALTAIFSVLPVINKKDVIAFVPYSDLDQLEVNALISYIDWLRDVLHFLNLEKIRPFTDGSSGRFWKIWGSFFQYIKKINFSFIRALEMRWLILLDK